MADHQDELIKVWSRRFPLLKKIFGQFGKETEVERIPWFFAYLLSAASSEETGACCFVLKKTNGTTAVVAILLALIRLQHDFPSLVKDYAERVLRTGQRVVVKPGKSVYEYQGIWDGKPDLFRLKVMDQPTWFSFRLVDALRLEPTDRKRPKGKLRPPLYAHESSRLDELLALTTYGNNSLIRNKILLYMAQSRFARVLDVVSLSRGQEHSFSSLSDLLPWGSVGQNGELKFHDAYQIAGEPIIATTSVPEDLAMACSSTADVSKLVIVDGARGLARDLQAYDDITECQRTVIIASSDETEAIGLLKDRGCPIWYMSPEEMLIGEKSATEVRTRKSLVGATVRAAYTALHCKVSTIDCQDNMLQAAAESLENAAKIIAESEQTEEAEQILHCLYKLLMEFSECCFGFGGDLCEDFCRAKALLQRTRNWLDSDVVAGLCKTIETLEQVISVGFSGHDKANAMMDSLHSEVEGTWVVVARSPRTAKWLQEGLRERGSMVEVLTVPSIEADKEYEGIIVPAWPNQQKFARLKNQAVTAEIRILVYPFERKWVLGYQAREREETRKNQLGSEKRSSILNVEERLVTAVTTLNSRDKEETKDYSLQNIPVFEIENRLLQRRMRRPSTAVAGEESREAQLVQFYGDCYALLTEWATLPKLNQLAYEANPSGVNLPATKASQLRQGDYVLFRTSGDKEFIRLIAEDLLGSEIYQKVRKVAEYWKAALRTLGNNPDEIRQILLGFGLERSSMTIAGWLRSHDRIGPRDFHDIEVIAKAAKDEELLSAKEDVAGAIADIRGAHIAAGNRLTQIILSQLDGRLDSLDDQPLQLVFDYGEAWVVQVDMVDDRQQKYPLNMVNSLLWADDALF